MHNIKKIKDELLELEKDYKIKKNNLEETLLINEKILEEERINLLMKDNKEIMIELDNILTSKI